jgi:hypothetical protein
MEVVPGKDRNGSDELSEAPHPPPEIDPLIWGPVLNGLCSLHETETVYSLEDIMVMNVALEYKAALEKHSYDKAMKKQSIGERR